VGNVSCSRYVKQAKLVDVSNIIGEERYRQSDLAKFALASAVDHLFFVSWYDRVQAGTYVDHFSGITLLTNLGFKKAADLSGLRPGAMRYEVLKDDWSAHPSRVPRVRVEPPPWESGTPDSG
jgi:RimJ/RimL family protein N-acetyltransferase